MTSVQPEPSNFIWTSDGPSATCKYVCWNTHLWDYRGAARNDYGGSDHAHSR